MLAFLALLADLPTLLITISVAVLLTLPIGICLHITDGMVDLKY